jgi:hypothetical protein
MAGGVPAHLHAALYQQYLDELQRTEPRVRIIAKRDSRFCKLIDRVLRVVTFGKQDRFLTDYTTTLGSRIYVPDVWEQMPFGERYCTLRHELVHVRQFRRLTWPGIALVYVLLPVPAGFAAGRAWLELQAYRESFVAWWQVYGRARATSEMMMQHVVERFTGPDYGWMWVAGGQVRRALQRTLEQLERTPPEPLQVHSSGR